jgi:methyl coenzyme M reductase beta subunit
MISMRNRGHFVVYANRYVFAIGGACLEAETANKVKIEMYDAVNNKWAAMGNLALAVENQGHNSHTIKSLLKVTNGNNYFSKTYEFIYFLRQLANPAAPTGHRN